MNRFRILIIFLFGITIVFPSTATSMIKLDSLPTDQTLVRGRFSNGLAYYVKKNTFPAGKIFIQVTVKVGYFHEDHDQAHVAHVLEHLGFQKSENFLNIGQFLRSQGLRPGTDYNAATGFTDTNYWLAIPSNDFKLFEQCLLVARDWCGGLMIDSLAVEIERNNVANEIGGRSSAAPNLESSIITDVNITENNKAKTRSVDAFTVASLKRFYRDWYRPDLQAITVVGDFDQTVAFEAIAKMFNVRSRQAYTRPWQSYVPKISCKRRLIVDSTANIDRVVIRNYHRVHNRKLYTIDDFRYHMLVRIYNVMMINRLNHLEWTEENRRNVFRCQYEYGIINSDAEVDAFVSEIVVNDVVSKSAVNWSLRSIFEEEERIQRIGFSEIEMQHALKSITHEMESGAIPNSDVLADVYRGNFRGRRSTPSPHQIDSLSKMVLAEITTEELNSFARKSLAAPSDLVMVCSQKLKVFLPDSLNIALLKEEISSGDVRPFKWASVSNEKPLLSDKEVKRLASVKISYSELHLAKMGTTKVTLKNGVEIIFKRLGSSGVNRRVIRLAALKSVGASQYSHGDYLIARYCPRLIYECGVGEHTKDEMNRFLKENGNSTIYPYVFDDRAGITAEFELSGLEDALKVVYQYLKSPRYDIGAFNAAREAVTGSPVPRSIYDSLLSKFMGIEEMSLSVVRNSGDLNMDRVFEIYRDIFWNKGKLTVILTGDFDPAEIKQTVIKYFSDYKGKDDQHELLLKRRDIAGKASAYEVVRKSHGNGVGIDIYLMARYSHEEKSMLDLSLLSKVIGETLTRKLRDEMGSTYLVAVNCSQMKTNAYQIIISFTTINQSAEMVLAATWAEISNLIAHGVTDSFVKGIASQQSAELARIWNDHDFWQRYFYLCIVNGVKYDDILTWSDTISKLRPDDINGIIKRYIKYNGIYRKVLKQA